MVSMLPPHTKGVHQPSGTEWYYFQTENQMSLKQQLLEIFTHDAEFISERDAHYESSWKARGGPGAFFTIARPWDRFAAIAKRGIIGIAGRYMVQPWDILGIIKHEQDRGLTESNDGTLQACIRDLRAYMALLAVEAMTMRQVYKPQLGTVVSDPYVRVSAGACASPKEQAPTLAEELTKLKDDRMSTSIVVRSMLDLLIQHL